MKNPLIIGNWKLNNRCCILNELISTLNLESDSLERCTVAIAPPEIYVSKVKKLLSNTNIFLAAQNIDTHLIGSFTGETSCKMLKDVGVKYVIIGHSERRLHHKESNNTIAKKFKIVRSHNLIPVVCIGETEEEYLSGKTKAVCVNQLDYILSQNSRNFLYGMVIAYEPIWAIGTGRSAHPIQVQETHKFIRGIIEKKTDIQIANSTILQYGGSVNAKNARALLSQPDVDGALIGSAALEHQSFSAIIKIASLL